MQPHVAGGLLSKELMHLQPPLKGSWNVSHISHGHGASPSDYDPFWH